MLSLMVSTAALLSPPRVAITGSTGKLGTEAGKQLVKVTHDCWRAAIEYCKPGQPYKGIGSIIEDYIKPYGYTSVRHFCGHGIGKVFHTTPNVLHYKNSEPGRMEVGHCFTIEPMINLGGWRDRTWPDDWTAVTADGSKSAQFEHTFLVTEDGYEILTMRDGEPRMAWDLAKQQR